MDLVCQDESRRATFLARSVGRNDLKFRALARVCDLLGAVEGVIDLDLAKDALVGLHDAARFLKGDPRLLPIAGGENTLATGDQFRADGV